MQYLILHVVRGEPTFDVAEKTMIGDEEGWVLCTCGHRAYPYWHIPISKLALPSIANPPEDWPDHYKPIPQKPPDISAFLSSLSKFVRRI